MIWVSSCGLLSIVDSGKFDNEDELHGEIGLFFDMLGSEITERRTSSGKAWIGFVLEIETRKAV